MKQFGSSLKRLFKRIVMGFNAKGTIINKDRVEEPRQAPLPPLDLKKGDIEILLNLIKESHFKGEHVQKIFELVLKLQAYYTKLP